MQNNKHKKDHLEEILNSLDSIKRASPRPFLFTRVMAKLSAQNQSSWEKISYFITRPATAFAGIFILLIINLLAAYLNLKTPSSSDQSELTPTEEYTQVASNMYDLENPKP